MSDFVTCHNGHKSLQGLWDCPVCMEKKMAIARQLKKAAESALAAMWDGNLSGKGITNGYANVVDREVTSAIKAAEEVGI